MTSGKSRPVIWNGIEYPNMAAAARALGITRETMRLRVNAGKTCDVMTCSWNGISYPSISEAARANDLQVATMNYRLQKGYTCDADVPPVGRPKNS